MTSLDELRAVERADVLKGGQLAARLVRRRDSVVFAYEEEYASAGGRPVATTLPFSRDAVVTHAAGALPPFFSGLLPEGRRLSALRAAVKTSADDEYTLLLAVGGDPVGDVQIVPHGSEPIDVEPRLTVDEWNQVRFRDLFVASVGDMDAVQDKVSARMINIPVPKQSDRFILKLDPPEFPHLVANEAFFLEAARRSGLETAEAEVVRDCERVDGLLVRRFDRVADASGRAVRLAQEDGCQVLAHYPADKYRLSTEEMVAAMSGICRAQPVAALTLLKQVAFAYLSCNGDAHAKNFSIRQLGQGEWRVTPAYDLPSSYPYGDTTMALTINGRSKEDIGRADFLALGAAVGLKPRAVARALDELCDRVDAWIGGVADLPFDEGRLIKLRRSVEYRRARLAGPR